MNVSDVDAGASRIAAAIGEPARARMLFHLLDGAARTSTELALVAEVSPSTASTHLGRLLDEKLVKVHVQGKHRYYSLAGSEVASVLEGLSVLAGGARKKFAPSTPDHLRAARTCYDHIAGALGVALHDRFLERGWLVASSGDRTDDYELTNAGCVGFGSFGVNVDPAATERRRFAYACLDWSERRCHLGGALAGAVLARFLHLQWVNRRRGRSLVLSRIGRQALDHFVGRLEIPN